MGGPWDNYQAQSGAQEQGPWQKYSAPPPAAPPEEPKKGPSFISMVGSGMLNQAGVPASPEDVGEGASALGSDLWGMVKGAPKAAYDLASGHKLRDTVKNNYDTYKETGKLPIQLEDEARKKAGYGIPYRLAAPVGEQLGVNVPGMEESAAQGSSYGVLGHAAAVPVAMAATKGLEAAGPAITEGVGELAPRVKPYATAPVRLAARSAEAAANQKLLPVKPILKIMTPADAAGELHLKIPGRDVGLGRPTPPPPMPGAPLPATPAPELMQSRALGGYEAPGPQAASLGRIPVRATPEAPPAAPPAAPAAPVAPTPARVGDLLNEGLGGPKPLRPGVPLRLQNAPPAAAPLPEGHTPVQSSALKSYKYDPVTKEFESLTPSGGHYIHGDVSPEQAAAFEQSGSKGKAWNDLRKNSTPVAKVVNGQRVAVKPPMSLRSAAPEPGGYAPAAAPTEGDLSDVLQKSVDKVKAAKAAPTEEAPAADRRAEARPEASERRQNVAERKRVDQMSPEEMQKELLSSRVTNGPNVRAFDEASGWHRDQASNQWVQDPGAPKSTVGMSDMANLKWVNERFGMGAGDALLRAKDEALQDAGIKSFHISGDEFTQHAPDLTPEQLSGKLKLANEALKDRVLRYTDPKTGDIYEVSGASFRHGVGTDMNVAEQGMTAAKVADKAANPRGAQGTLRVAKILPEEATP